MLKKLSVLRLNSDDEIPLPPLRSELFSAAQMEQHGAVLASSHKVRHDQAPDQLLPRLADNEEALLNACAALTAALKENRQITPAAEWLLDNFYLIEEQIRTAKQHLPKGYSKELPRLLKGPSMNRPRVYDIALETISHGDGRVDPEGLSRFVAAYQQITVLKLGELWAIPIMLRLALIENLRRVATRIATSRIDRNLADSWADQMIEAAEKDPSKLILLVADMARSEPTLDTAFVAEVARRLQGQSPALTLPLTWISQRLAETGTTIEQLVQLESQRQAADQVSISNSIGSLRFLGAMDWREFVETMSHVEHVLSLDHADIYSKMDFSTRDRYRHVIENLAKNSALTEVEVAQQALILSELASKQDGAQGRTAHIGYYLIGQGRSALEKRINVRHGLIEKILQKSKRIPLRLYLGSIIVLTSIFTFGLLMQAYEEGMRGGILTLLTLIVILASSQLAMGLVNWLITVLSTPQALPRMDFSKAIPPEASTLVVVPTMLLNQHNIENLCEALEVRYLANRDDHIRFCLLTDLADADAESMPEDAALVEQAAELIAELNHRYEATGQAKNAGLPLAEAPAQKNTPFLLLHRSRQWNAQEKIWMGYERKRGKLSNLNAFLRTGTCSHTSTLFSKIVGEVETLSSVKYVITLDTDTQLPRDSARQFIATMAHPLNQARYDDVKQRVVEGYGILQPRVVASLPSANASMYEKLCGGETGIDPYTRSVSDVYQDLFHEGSFIGKGIYDVDAFERALHQQLPENRILSHDLLEGCYARAGLISDIQLHEEYPSRYSVDVSRRHRWIRGDWQLITWLMPKVPVILSSPHGLGVASSSKKSLSAPSSASTQSNELSKNTHGMHAASAASSDIDAKSDAQMNAEIQSALSSSADAIRKPNPLSTLSRWKILDNLRRSLISFALLLTLILGWVVLPSSWLWSVAVVTVLFLPSIAASLLDLVKMPREVLVRQHLVASVRSAEQHMTIALLNLAFLPYEAFYSLDAILRTLWRILISHRGMLEWKSSGESAQQIKPGIVASFRTMWSAPVISLMVMMAVIVLRPGALSLALPFLLLWMISPVIAWRISFPIAEKRAALETNQLLFLNRLARKTWAFFETYIVEEDHYLPPDNMQEHPVAAVAHRTSPTNIGLALLANLTAYDFAYINMGQLLRRTDNTMHSMGQLERYQGHFYNWYDTQTLKPLNPVYVSTVDSGNLAGHLLTLRAGLLMLPEQPIVHPHMLIGINQTFDVLMDLVEDKKLDAIIQFKTHIEAACIAPPDDLHEVIGVLDLLVNEASELVKALHFNPDLATDTKPMMVWWATALATQCREAQQDLLFLAPWLSVPGMSELIHALPELKNTLDLSQLARLESQLKLSIEMLNVSVSAPDSLFVRDQERMDHLLSLVAEGGRRATERLGVINRLALQATEFARMEYSFLYDSATHLMAIGYNVTDRRRDLGCYDLLASEARLCTFVAIAQGQLPQEAWFALGRQLTIAGGEPILLSWSGSMFEYLMPLLVMPNYPNTLLDQTYKSVIDRQIEYGAQRGVAWGISESGYHAFDASLNYQYRAFGVPGLGLKRGLGDDLVIAPYASVLALMIAPGKSCENLQRLSQEGAAGHFGMYEAIDYTPARLPRGQTQAMIRSYMAHHQGMSFLSLAYVLLDRPMQKRFESDPLFQATLLLLKERIPKPSTFYSNTTELADIRSHEGEQQMPMRIINRVETRLPEVQLLSNGRYHVMVTHTGGSYSRWRDMSVTRWREDSTRDDWGTFCYIRDFSDSSYWSTTFQPTLKQPKTYEVIFSEGRAEIRRHDNGFDMHTEIVVSPEDDIELRRTRITNRTRVTKTIDVTSYSEVVIAPAAGDTMHPAFSNLFVQTEILPQHQAIVCARRPRSDGDFTPTMFHLMVVHGVIGKEISYETDRMAFIGRGNTLAAPSAMSGKTLSGSHGSVLDPIVAIRHQITLEPEQFVIVDIVNGIAETRDAVMSLIEKYHDRHLADRVFELAWTHSQVVIRQLNASEADAQLYGRLASSIIYPNALLRADASILVKNRRGQSGLWSYAISGDLPIVLLQISDADNIELVRQMVQAHAYWRMKGLAVDLVIWNEDRAGYRQILQDQIMGLVASGMEAHAMERPGGIFVRLADQIPNDDRILLQSVARAILSDSRGTLAEQINRRGQVEVRPPLLTVTKQAANYPASYSNTHLPSSSTVQASTTTSAVLSTTQKDLLLFNGLGGFSKDGREYVITTDETSLTPAPWVNVLANPHFGSVISESGQAYTWGENAHEFRLTPWSNDPVSDGGGEVFYLRDEESGHFWSPTSLPRRGSGSYVTRHGFGYSIFEHTENGIVSELTVYVAPDHAVKFSVLKVRNESGVSRSLSATGYVEWVLGDIRQKSMMHIVTEADPATGAIFARNFYNSEFCDRTVFFYVDASKLTMSGDRTEFIGRNGNLQNPAAMSRARLSGKLGAGLDPCAAIQVPFELVHGEQYEVIFMLGMSGQRSADVSSLIQRFRGKVAASETLVAVKQYWDHTLGAVQVNTPDISLNLLTNGWLMYQTIACRLWARSGFYQSGGAFGYRDQLQDVMAIIHTRPEMTREHILICASHQFIEGDVQHWWHPPLNRGVRTHCSDDYLWLPLATCRYLTSTHDLRILDEEVVFIEGRPVNSDEDSYYDLPGQSSQSASLYDHCVRSINHGLRFGVHGLPLIGSCDWNDGMDQVGSEGRGESVWLGFFLYEVLMQFSEVAQQRGDQSFSYRCQLEAKKIQANIEQNAWDGGWYRRAYFDDGQPLGSASNAECQIDSISQSWSILSEAGDPVRSRTAMQAVDRRLVKRDHALVQLLDPPFDKSGQNPGYIRGYVPGVRENGGQYTHAAIWTAMAFAKLKDQERAWELLHMINPINHALTPADVATYKVEPYVVAADVYAVSPHIGRGGWTWYTGSSGWMYRFILESLLGLTLDGDKLHIVPCLPAEWDQFTLRYRYRETYYQISVKQLQNANASTQVIVNGEVQVSPFIPLLNDQQEHIVEVLISIQRDKTPVDLKDEAIVVDGSATATVSKNRVG